MTGDRVLCVVPFCPRSTTAAKIAPSNEWLCADHWRLVDRRRKSIYRRVKRYRPKLAPIMWDNCKRQAIERAMGISA